jgi:hypothetical protein
MSAAESHPRTTIPTPPIPGAMRSIEPGTHNPDCPKVRTQLEANVFMGPGLRFAHPGMGAWNG